MEDKIKELEEQIAELKEQLKKQKESKHKRWRAKLDEKYWRVDKDGMFIYATERINAVDKYNYNIGNYFETSEEAELYKKKLIAYQAIKDDAGGFEPDWKDGKQSKWYVEYDSYDKRMELDWLVWKARNDIYFATKEDAQESLKKHEAEWKLLLGVED